MKVRVSICTFNHTLSNLQTFCIIFRYPHTFPIISEFRFRQGRFDRYQMYRGFAVPRDVDVLPGQRIPLQFREAGFIFVEADSCHIRILG